MLKSGDNVFAIFSKPVPLTYMGVAMKLIPQLGLVPFAYHGLEKPPSGTSSNVYREFVDDFYKCQALFIFVANVAEIAFKEGGLLVEDIKSTKSRGIPIHLYLIPDGQESLPASQSIDAIESIPIQINVSSDDFAEKLRNDLCNLMR